MQTLHSESRVGPEKLVEPSCHDPSEMMFGTAKSRWRTSATGRPTTVGIPSPGLPTPETRVRCPDVLQETAEKWANISSPRLQSFPMPQINCREPGNASAVTMGVCMHRRPFFRVDISDMSPSHHMGQSSSSSKLSSSLPSSKPSGALSELPPCRSDHNGALT